MNSKFIYSVLILALISTFSLGAQMTFDGKPPVYDSLTRTYMLTVPEEVFDNGPYQMFVVIDEGVTNVSINGQQVTDADVVEFPSISRDVKYSLTFTRDGVTTRSSIHFTFLPILTLSGSFGNDYVQGPVQLILPESEQVQNYQARVKWAGSSTNGTWTHKRNYHLKFVDDDGEKMEVSFFGLRSDNHWRLDAGTVDMIRFRNKAAHDLWADFATKPYYADKEPKARSYVRGTHIEVFLNGEYNGFYNMTECLDRKQMKLKKYEEQEDSVINHGFLWKAKEATPQTLFMANTLCDDTLDNWAGFELEYPDIEDVNPTDYSVLRNAVRFVANSDQAAFNAHAGEYFDLPVLVDYYVFINTLFAIDNVCKNILWGCYDSQVDKKLTIGVWDLDVTVGQHWRDLDGYYHSEAVQPEQEMDQSPACMLPNNLLFNYLREMPEFNMWVVNRYWQLRNGILDPANLVDRYEQIYNRLECCGALDRETVRWSDTGDIAHRDLEFDVEFEYLSDWLRKRIAYMDANTFACLRGDVNGDGRLNIVDLNILIDALLHSYTVQRMAQADVNADNKVNIDDVVELINVILMD